MKTAAQIARRLTPRIRANNAAIGETNRRLAKIGDGQGNPQPPALLTPRDVFYRSSLDQNDRGVAILHPKCPIPIQQIDGYYDVEVWVANGPGSAQVYIMDLADGSGFGTDGIAPTEALANSAAFPSQDRLVIMRIAPSVSGGMAVFVDVGIYQIAYEVGDGTFGFLASADADISDPANPVTFNPTASALGSGEHRLVGIAFDGRTGQFFAIPGAAQSTSETLPSAESRSEFTEDDYLAIDFTGYCPCGYVYTYYGQTAPDEDDCLRLYDPRFFIKKAGDGAYWGTIQTTNATVTTLYTFTIPDSTTFAIHANVTARRTGGSSGTAEDGAYYERVAAFKNVAGVAAQIGSTSTPVTLEDQAGWDVTFDVTGATARVRVTGAANNDVSWILTAKVYQVSS